MSYFTEDEKFKELKKIYEAMDGANPTQPTNMSNHPYGGYETEDIMNLAEVFSLSKIEVIDEKEVSSEREIEHGQDGGTTDPSWDTSGIEYAKYEITFLASVVNSKTNEPIDLSKLNLGEDPIEELCMSLQEGGPQDISKVVLKAARILYDEIDKWTIYVISFKGHLIKGLLKVATSREMDDSDKDFYNPYD